MEQNCGYGTYHRYLRSEDIGSKAGADTTAPKTARNKKCPREVKTDSDRGQTAD